MARKVKNQEERKNEILQIATKLFREKGFEQTVVGDIVKAAGIAQGTFYLYYRSKVDIFIAVLESINEMVIEKLIEVQQRSNLNAVEKLNLITNLEFALNREQDDLYMQLHLEENEGIHHKYIVNRINRLKPIYYAVILQGISEGVFDIQYPKEAAEYMLVATKFMFDPAVFSANKEELQTKIMAVLDITERLLGVTKDSLNFDVLLSKQ